MKNVNFIDISISLSNICNLQCNYCITQYGIEELNIFSKKKEILSDQSISSIISLLVKYVQLHPDIRINISFIGGEPMLHKDKIEYFFQKLCTCICDKNIFRIEFITNTIPLDKNWMEFLKKYNYMYYFRCSAHFLSSDNNDFDKNLILFLEKIQLIDEYKYSFQINIVLSEFLLGKGFSGIQLFIHKLLKLTNKKKLRIEPLLDTYNQVTLNTKNINGLYQIIRSLIYIALIKKNIDLNVLCRNFVSYLNINTEYSNDCSYNYKKDYLNLQITPTGDVHSCSIIVHTREKLAVQATYLGNLNIDIFDIQDLKKRFLSIGDTMMTYHCPSRDGKYNILLFKKVFQLLFTDELVSKIKQELHD